MSQPMIGAGQSLGVLVNGVTFEDNYFDPDDNRIFDSGTGLIIDQLLSSETVSVG